VEVQRLRDRSLGRPRVERAPLVAARFKHRGFGLREVPLVLQVVGKKGRLNFLPIVLPGRRTEIDFAELLSRSARPTAMPPRADDEEIPTRGVVLFQLAIDGDGSVEILLVPPPSH